MAELLPTRTYRMRGANARHDGAGEAAWLEDQLRRGRVQDIEWTSGRDMLYNPYGPAIITETRNYDGRYICIWYTDHSGKTVTSWAPRRPTAGGSRFKHLFPETI